MKLINKILDRYYLNRFLEEIEPLFIFNLLDYRYIKNKCGIKIQLKPFQYENRYYKDYEFIHYKKALYYFIRQDDYIKRAEEDLGEFKKLLNEKD